MEAKTPTAMGRLIAECLRAKGWSQADLARALAVPDTTVSTWLNRSPKELPIQTISSLSRVLGIHTARLVAAYFEDAGEPFEMTALDSADALDGDGAILINTYTKLPTPHQQSLVKIAQDLLDLGNNQTTESHPPKP